MTWKTRPRSEFSPLAAIRTPDPPQVVLIHGVGLRAEAWGAQLNALGGVPYAAVDLPGHGDSPLTEDIVSLQDYADAVVAALDRPVCLAGHSMGALIALDIAIRYPGRVRAVLALNTVFQRDAQAARAVQARAEALDGASPADPSNTLTRWFGDQPSAERTACEAWLRDIDPRAYQRAYRIFAHENGPDPQLLAQLSCPIFCVTGADEPNSTPAMSQRLAEIAPQGRARVIEGAAHMLPMTHADPVNHILHAMLREVS